MTAQTVLPEDVGVLPQARDNAETMARPDTSMPFGGDGSRTAGAPLASDTAIVAVAPSHSTFSTGSLPVCSSTFSTKTLTTTRATGISLGFDQAVSHSRTSWRDSRRLVRLVAHCVWARWTLRRPSLSGAF